MSSITQSPKKRGLRVLDPDLPFLAAKVAVDVDILLAGKLKDRSAMTQLAEKLLESTSLSSGVQRPQMDFATLTILRGAVSETANTTSLTEVENLLERAREIAEILEKGTPDNNREKLEEAGNFCMALSQATAAHVESIRDLRPVHPFRK